MTSLRASILWWSWFWFLSTSVCTGFPGELCGGVRVFERLFVGLKDLTISCSSGCFHVHLYCRGAEARPDGKFVQFEGSGRAIVNLAMTCARLVLLV